MRAIALAAVFTVSVPAFAQIQVQVQLPSIVFPAPPTLVVVEPGIQVVEDYDHEVFFVDSWYWHRSGAYWYRTKNHSGGWVLVEPRFVPPNLVVVPVGRYKRWKRGNPHGAVVVQPGKAHRATVVVDPPGPGPKVKIKGGKHH